MTTLPGKAALPLLVEETEGLDDHRRSYRSDEYHAEDLRVEPEHSFGGWAPPTHSGVGAQLVDVSDTGMGLKVFSPLLANTDVKVSVNLYAEGSGEELKADARVVHCLEGEDNLYRVGLVFWNVDRRPLDYGYVPDLDSEEPLSFNRNGSRTGT